MKLFSHAPQQRPSILPDQPVMQPFQQLKTEKSNSVNANVNPHESPLWYVRVAGKHRDGVQAKVAKSDSREREDGAGDLDRSRDDVGSFLARNISDLLSIRVILRGVGRDELAQREVVDNVLYLLHVDLTASTRLRRMSFFRLSSWKPAWRSLINLEIFTASS